MDKKAIKILLIILTILAVIILPYWIGPSTFDKEKNPLIREWILGMFIMIAIAIIVVVVINVTKWVYELWDEIIK